MRSIVLVLAVSVVLAGCSSAHLRVATDAAARANDDVVESAMFAMCRGASVGSIRRKFNTHDKAQLWLRLCAESVFTPHAVRE